MKKPARLLVFVALLICSVAVLWFLKTPSIVSPEAESNGVTITFLTPTPKK